MILKLGVLVVLMFALFGCKLPSSEDMSIKVPITKGKVTNIKEIRSIEMIYFGQVLYQSRSSNGQKLLTESSGLFEDVININNKDGSFTLPGFETQLPPICASTECTVEFSFVVSFDNGSNEAGYVVRDVLISHPYRTTAQKELNERYANMGTLQFSILVNKEGNPHYKMGGSPAALVFESSF